MVSARAIILLISTLLSACTIEAREPDMPPQMAVETVADKAGNEGELKKFKGPGYVCGWTFAIDLRADENTVRIDPGLDFVTYRVADQNNGFLLYEGNHPQEADMLLETGKGFPSVVAIHLPPETPQSNAKQIKQRLIMGERHETICKTVSGNIGEDS